MSLSERIAKLYESKTAGRRVAREFLRQVLAMSMAEAKETLGFYSSDDPSDEEVNRAYRQRYIDNRKLHPDMGGDPALAVALNVAKDTLLGVMAPDRGDPGAYSRNRSRRTQEPSGGWQERDRYRPNEEPVPPPPGGPFQSAVSTNVDWKILSSPTYKKNYVVEEGVTAPNGRPSGYWDVVDSWVLIGVAPTELVFLDLKQHSRMRDNRKTLVSAWSSKRTIVQKKDLLKVGPKVVKKLQGDFPRRPKFMVLESKPSEAMIEKARPTLSFKDAAIGSGLASAEKGRKAQVELEPVLDRERWKAIRNDPSRQSYEAYDWFVYVNGRKTKLDEDEVKRMDRNYIFLSVFSYNYDKKVNLTRLRGSRMKMGPKESIQKLAESLNPGSLKSQLEDIARAL